MNDVWLYLAMRDQLSFDAYTSRNGVWFRLPDAPFTPRSEMASRLQPGGVGDAFAGIPYQATRSILLHLFGGQTSHSCGLRVLGQCSDEVWQMNITRIGDSAAISYDMSEPGFSLVWTRVGRLTFGARCGMAVDSDYRLYSSRQRAAVALVGGQLSYSDTEQCAAAIETVNSVWLSSWPQLSDWRRGRDAPFSPRRSMQSDDVYVDSDDSLFIRSWFYMKYDKSTSLTGGIRYIAHRRQQAVTGNAVLTQAELYAGVWTCTLPTPELDPTPLDCDWAHSYPIANLSRPMPSTPTASLAAAARALVQL